MSTTGTHATADTRSALREEASVKGLRERGGVERSMRFEPIGQLRSASLDMPDARTILVRYIVKASLSCGRFRRSSRLGVRGVRDELLV